LTLNPYFRLYDLCSKGNALAGLYNISNRKVLEFQSGVSAILSFRKDYTFSTVFQYNSPQNNIQDNSYSDALYFFSFDKTFKKSFKVGIGSGLTFNRSFVYNGSEVQGPGYYSRYNGIVRITSVPFWFRLSYQFSTGSARHRIERDKEDSDNPVRKAL
jgi:hypothetical protein